MKENKFPKHLVEVLQNAEEHVFEDNFWLTQP